MTKGRKNQKTPTLNKEIRHRLKNKFMKKNKNIRNLKTKAKEPTNFASKLGDIKEPSEHENFSAEDISNKNIGNNLSTLYEKIENEYMDKLLNIHYDTYANSYLNNALERIKQNKKVLTEEILNKFGMTETIRKCVLNYFELFIETHKIKHKLYFFSVSLFDSFLINYSESNSDDLCHQLLLSKKDNKFSTTKSMLLMFCCYYLIAKYSRTKLLTIDDLLKYPKATEEFTHMDLYRLIKQIISCTESDTLNIYTFIELYLFQVKRCLKSFNWENYPKFVEILEKSISFLGAKLGGEISLQKIECSIQALGIIIFSYELCKIKYEVNSNIDSYVNMFLVNLKDVLSSYYGENKLPTIIDWLNNNWNK